MLGNLVGNWIAENALSAARLPNFFEAILNNVAGFSDVAPLRRRPDRVGFRERTIADIDAPKLGQRHVGVRRRRPLKSSALEKLVNSSRRGVDKLFCDREAKVRQPAVLVPEVAEDSPHIVAGLLNVQYLSRRPRRPGRSSHCRKHQQRR
ncbi:MAG: hypothetical protein HC828_11075 [Blastochloris sp.]|nr:hypothetical protein [Blastochloris sp.]